MANSCELLPINVEALLAKVASIAIATEGINSRLLVHSQIPTKAGGVIETLDNIGGEVTGPPIPRIHSDNATARTFSVGHAVSALLRQIL